MRTLFAAAFILFSGALFAQGVSTDEMNKSNNPLNPSPAGNLQDYYSPKLYGTGGYTNDVLLRGTLPVAPGDTIKAPQIFRLTVPVSTRPDPSGGNATGLGDINLFDIFLLGKWGGTEIGVGPLLTIPTASQRSLGTGKWQGGAAAVAIHPEKWGMLGGLVQWQASFAGAGDRADVNTLTAQPFFIYNLPQGWYLRSTGTWTFDLKNDKHYIPVGLGVGTIWKSGHTTYNLFAEPQWTVSHDGVGYPKFTMYAGLNMTFGK